MECREKVLMKQLFKFLSLVMLLSVMPFGVAHGAPAAAGAEHAAAAHAVTAPETAALDPRDSAFSAHEGTWLNWVARQVFYGGKPLVTEQHEGETHVKDPHGVYYDYLVISVLLMALLGAVFFFGVRKVTVRPGDKPAALPHLLEAAVEGFHKYCVSVMGNDLASKYSPLISAFFFTILLFNWIGLIPGLIAPTSNPNVPFGLAIVGFFCVHFIAIREAGLKSYLMHYVGEPLWLAWLNIPLHIVGELVKPVSLAMRLLGNIFGDETVVAQLALLGISAFFIPFQFPMMIMGMFMGLLQAVVFATLLAIYISIFAEHHDAHDENNVHGTTEHVRVFGHEEIVAHPSETTLA